MCFRPGSTQMHRETSQGIHQAGKGRGVRQKPVGPDALLYCGKSRNYVQNQSADSGIFEQLKDALAHFGLVPTRLNLWHFHDLLHDGFLPISDRQGF